MKKNAESQEVFHIYPRAGARISLSASLLQRDSGAPLYRQIGCHSVLFCQLLVKYSKSGHLLYWLPYFQHRAAINHSCLQLWVQTSGEQLSLTAFPHVATIRVGLVWFLKDRRVVLFLITLHQSA